MPSADFRFVPLAPGGGDVLALAAGKHPQPRDGEVARTLARSWVQARDRLTAEAERQAREEADQRDTVRRALLAALGHDFRTPLTLLKSGLAELDGDAPARLGGEVDRIIRLSEDLIAAARLETGQAARVDPVDLVDIAAAAIPKPENGIAVRTELPDDLPLVQGDAVMLTHVLGNLVHNALRHARAEVVIAVRADDGFVLLDVRDDGPGIDPAVTANIFDRFVSGPGGEGGLGLGLGLAIARDLASAMGASLSAGDAPGGGACFTLRLAQFPLRALPA
jgi:two-component system sensor histidine kinase KdpD